MMCVADANYKLLYIDVGRNGRNSDGGVFNTCSFARAMDGGKLNIPPPKPLPGRDISVPYVLVADEAFAMRPDLMKPFGQRGLQMTERIYNYRLSRARRIIENVFGIMSAVFRVLRKPIALNAEKTKKIILACCVLHNYLLDTNKQKYASSNTFDREDEDGNILPGEWRREEAPNGTMHPLQRSLSALSNAKYIREEFVDYFINEGDLDWQYHRI